MAFLLFLFSRLIVVSYSRYSLKTLPKGEDYSRIKDTGMLDASLRVVSC